MPDPSNTATDANKAVGAGLAGAATIVLVWIAHQWGHIDVPPEVASAFTVIMSTGAAWLTPHSN